MDKADNRFKAYKFFAFLYSYPDDESFFNLLEEFYPFEDKTPLQELKKIPLPELQAEYTRLFVANYGGVPCKPYQSVFGPEKELLGGPAFDTAKFYNLFGLETGNELPDKVSLQLDFMAFLWKLYNETPYRDDKQKLKLLMREFFNKHILWMEKFADCVVRSTDFQPLKELSEKFKDFLKEEKNFWKSI